MRKLLVLPLLGIILACSNPSPRGVAADAFADSVAKLPATEGYNACIKRLSTAPGDGSLYRTTYFRAIEADSVRAYAAFLDDISAKQPPRPHQMYIAACRALCGYLMKETGYTERIRASISLSPSTDRTEEMVCAHIFARLLSETNTADAYSMQQRAIHAMRHGGRWNSAEVLAQAADLCCDMGRYPEAMDLLNEAHDSLETNGMPVREAVYVLGTKANLYSRVEMYDSALSVNRTALDIVGDNNYLLTDLLVFRAFIFDGKGQRDSAYICLDSAERVVNRFTSPYSKVFKRYIRARRAVLALHKVTDSTDLNQAIEDLEGYIPDHGGAWEEQLSLGYVRWLTGDAGGLEMMELVRDSLSAMKEPELLLRADRVLIEIYLSQGRHIEATALYNETFALADSLDMRHARYQSIASDLQYRVSEHMRENRELRREINAERSRVFWLTVACILGLILLAWGGCYIVLSRRLQLRRRAIDSHQITTLIENQKVLNRRIEQLQRAGETDPDWSELIPSSMSADDTARFRQSFMALYPGFIDRLKARCPGLTTGDENLCMLIRIGQSTDDIALALGISKASANSARYRIRKKMGLTKDESLDDIVMTM